MKLSNLDHYNLFDQYSNSQGFSLIEVLVSLAIFAGGIIGVLSAYSISSRTYVDTLRLDKASQIIEREIESAIAFSSGQYINQKKQEGIYSYTVQYQDKPYELKAVLVEVNWQVQGKKRKLNVTRIFKPKQN